MMEKTLKINKIQGVLLVLAGIVLLSAMCFAVVYGNFALTDKVANAEELPVQPRYPYNVEFGDFDYTGNTTYQSLWCVDADVPFISEFLSGSGVEIHLFTLTDDVGRTGDIVLNYNLSLGSNSYFYLRYSSDYYGNSEFLIVEGSIFNRYLVFFPNGYTITRVAGHDTEFNFVYLLLACFGDFQTLYFNQGYNVLVYDYNNLVDNYNQLEEDYNQLEEDYNQLEEDYNNIVESLQWVSLVDNIAMSVSPVNFTSTIGSSSIVSVAGIAEFTNVYAILPLQQSQSVAYPVVAAHINLGSNFNAGTRFRCRWNVMDRSYTSLPSGTGGVGLAYESSSGILTYLFFTDSSNCVSSGVPFEKEFTLPVDVNSLYIFGNLDLSVVDAGMLLLSNFSLDVLTDNTSMLIDDAYQRGVDSVNINYYINQGYQAGYSAGLTEDNPYTFRGLIGAAVDAPLEMFTRAFDFDILGVNMKSFYLSLFTLALVLIIVKFALGRL